MTYPENFEEKIGFDTIRNMLSEFCVSDLGRKNLSAMRFMQEHEAISLALSQTEEFREILISSRSFPHQDYFDLTAVLARIGVKGSYIQPDELHGLRSSLRTFDAILRFFSKEENRDDFPRLFALTEDLNWDPSLLEEIDSILEENGEVSDKASPALRKIRQDIHARLRQNEKVIQQILMKARQSGWVREDAEVTIRQGRLLIPVNASDKRKLQGFIHDESATGQTVYIEPAENFELNNAIRDLENAEKREIIRILTELTDRLRPQLDDLKKAFHFLGQMDFIRAKARLAIRLNAAGCMLEDRPLIDWKEARHPLLFLSHRQKNLEIVPLDIRLDEKERILIISGPNAGGKSVCLKTTGLLQYMLQCGLLIPAREDSQAGIFRDLFVEIGDEQSIDNDLSTYSSHLFHINDILREANNRSLFLVDEFGAGTDPQLGGALAEAALELLEKSGTFGVVTTHYSNLKLLADRFDSIVNGAMLFDTDNMRPLFRLRIGRPGSSFAFEIARKMGLPEELIERASSKTGKTQLDFEKQLQELELEKEKLKNQQKEFQVADSFLDELVGKYQDMVSELESSRKNILENARAEAERKIREANRSIEKTIKEIKESQAGKERTRNARAKLEKEREKLVPEKPAETEKPKKSPGLKEGTWASIRGQDAKGLITRIKGKNVTLDIQDVQFQTTLDKVEPAEEPSRSDKSGRRNRPAQLTGISDRSANFRVSIDLRGKKVDEALQVVRQYIDEAILFNAGEVRILHGKGEGVLRQVIREYLRTVSEVAYAGDEHVERGGAGITVVRFR